MKLSLLLAVTLIVGSLPAAVVHVRESVSVGGKIVATTERAVQTGERYVTGIAPEVEGAIFAQWTIGTAQQIEARDAWGRSLESAAFTVYEDTEVTAVYLDENEDTDGDGVPDALEIYWYGNLAQDADSDTDADGAGFLDELGQGLSPVFADEVDSGRVMDFSSSEVLYNPFGYVPYTIRSEPEGMLFTTINDWRLPGTEVTTPQFDPATSAFAYWKQNGERQQDDWGVAVDGLTFTAQSNELALVAVAEQDPWKRLSLYWYGDVGHGAESDADGDGYTFQEELEKGLSPVFADELDGGRVLAFDSDGVEVSLQDYEQVQGAIVDGVFIELFTSPIAGNSATSETFGANLQPVVADVNGDGLFDIVLVYDGGVRVLVNVGGKGNPEFERLGEKDENDGKDENDAASWSPLSFASFESFMSFTTPLPTYRDYPPSVSDFDYKVSSVSRFYTAGNSTPIETESPATEAVRAELGKVKFFWNDVAVKQGERAEVMLSIENSLNYDVAGKTQVVTYDPAYLTPLKLVKTGLTENVIYEESVADGKWTITLKSGKLAAGGGKFFTLVFDTLKAGTTKVGEATVTILEGGVPYQLGDVNGDGKIDELDVRLLAQLKNAAGRKWTANQLKAGDFNGNGKLDNADYQALRELLKEKGLL